MGYIHLILSFVALASCNIKTPKAISTSSNYTECTVTYDSLIKEDVYIKVEQEPEYPGGSAAFIKYFLSNYRQPANLDEFQTSFNLEFVINREGNLVGERIKNKNIANITQAEKEALRVLRNTSKWIPGKCENNTVPVRVIMPLKF